MNAISNSPSPKPRASLFASVAILTGALVLVFPLFAVYGWRHAGQMGVITAAVAGLTCWVGATLALICSAMAPPRAALAGLLGGMFFRMGLPLITAVALQQTQPHLAQSGIFGTILVYYLVALPIETALSIRMVNSPLHARKAA